MLPIGDFGIKNPYFFLFLNSSGQWLTVLNQQKRKQITPILGIQFLKVQTTVNKMRLKSIVL